MEPSGVGNDKWVKGKVRKVQGEADHVSVINHCTDFNLLCRVKGEATGGG